VRTLDVSTIVDPIAKMCVDANYYVEDALMKLLRKAKDDETSKLGKNILGQIIENDEIAALTHVPMCQDTGFVVAFVEIGTGLQLIGDLEAAINEGVRRGYDKGYLRKSVVAHPLDRVNTKDNTPAIVHYKLTAGDQLKITIAAKGAGSENQSQLRMLKPADGYDGVKQVVIDAVLKAGETPVHQSLSV